MISHFSTCTAEERSLKKIKYRIIKSFIHESLQYFVLNFQKKQIRK